MKQKLILTDVDGVCLSWGPAFTKYAGTMGYTEDPAKLDRYSLAHRFGAKKAVMDDIVHTFNTSENMLTLKAYQDAKHYVRLLHEHGFDFVAITSMSGDPVSHSYRKQNLDNVFGEGIFSELVCLPVGHSKYPVLERWEDSGCFWIEDKFTNALEGAAVGLSPILVSAPYNEGFESDRLVRVSEETPWEEIYSIVKTEYAL